ncbi:hypothetical protein ASZ90_015097 [hydrocarbon metagenome]|uniref:Uncharacterized protein n=1 Tax=hydrocarbon metagenome TaxID=938273 RepID=A0A0W8F2V8_9ZZZZ
MRRSVQTAGSGFFLFSMNLHLVTSGFRACARITCMIQ